MRHCIVLGKGSDIAQAMAKRLEADDWTVKGYSHEDRPTPERWDMLLVASGALGPIGRFAEVEFAAWAQCVADNALTPLEFVRDMLPFAKYDGLVVFFSGPNPHVPQPGYSAYDAGKMLLIRMTQNLAAEHTNVRFVCLGPGFHKTKIHASHDVSNRHESGDYGELYDMLSACWLAPRESLGRQIHIREPWRQALNPFPLNEGT